MKTRAIVALFLILTACQRASQESPLSISFSAIQSDTKSSFIGSEGIPIDDVFGISASSAVNGVWSASSATMDYFFNKDVVRKINEYEYLGKEYWPQQPLKFFAYYPFRAQNLILSPSTKLGYPTLDLTVNTDVSKQYDLMVGVTPILTPVPRVIIPFRHALSRIGFSFRTDATSTIVIISITINNIISRGIQSYNNQDEITWTLIEGSKSDYTVSALNGELIPDIVLSSEYTELTTNQGYLLMIPQKIATADITINVSYTENGVQKRFNTSLPQGEWLLGAYINYQITIPS